MATTIIYILGSIKSITSHPISTGRASRTYSVGLYRPDRGRAIVIASLRFSCL